MFILSDLLITPYTRLQMKNVYFQIKLRFQSPLRHLSQKIDWKKAKILDIVDYKNPAKLKVWKSSAATNIHWTNLFSFPLQ